MAAPMQNMLSFEGCNHFRQRLILSTVSGKSVKIKRIRHKDDDPGVRGFEANFIRMLEAITNGSNIVVNETGTSVFYQPGMLIGGELEHSCNPARSIGWYLEALVMLAPFCKNPIHALLSGVTNDSLDPSVDAIKWSSIPVMKRFLGTDEGLEIKVTKRGAPPGGGGQVFFSCPCRQKLRPVQFTEQGKIKRIRGVAWATRMSPVTCNRIVEATRSVLNQYIPDIYIYTDHQKGSSSGKSPGFGLTLVAETTTGVFLCAETASQQTEQGASVPEDVGILAAKLLLEEIYRGGCVDSGNQSLACLFMALGDKDVSKIKTGPLSPYTIQFLRHLKDFFHVTFKLEVIQEDEQEGEELRLGGDKVSLTCVGVGYRNLAKVTI